MPPDNIQQRLTELLVNDFNVEVGQITPEASFIDDLGLDSLDEVEMIMGIEEDFNLEIHDEEAAKLTTVGKAVAYLEKNCK